MSKRSGRKSQGANDFLMPYAPTINSASNVGTARPYNDGAVDVSFTADPRNAATSYTVLSSPGSYTASGASSPIRVTGLASDTAYTFTVTATNTYGTSAASAASGSVTATTVPATPGAPSATAQGAAATDDVSWSAPATGGSAITSYTWSSSDGKGATQAGTSVSVAQEAGTAQTYNVYATNANGNSGTSSNSGSVTSFSFTPFSFAPFGAFGFTPFGAFGFTPFGAFGFTPFGFTPFGAFGFSPPSCVHEDTLIDTPNGKVKAKDVQVGNEIVSVSFSEIPNVGANGESDFDYVGFSSPTLTVQEKTLTTVVDIVQSTKNSIMFFNQDQSALFSTTQPFFIKRNNNYEIIPSGAIEVGDFLISVNQNAELTETEILNIDYLTAYSSVYQFSCEPQDWFIAGDYLVHNK
jgi:chitodextrinase